MLINYYLVFESVKYIKFVHRKTYILDLSLRKVISMIMSCPLIRSKEYWAVYDVTEKGGSKLYGTEFVQRAS